MKAKQWLVGGTTYILGIIRKFRVWNPNKNNYLAFAEAEGRRTSIRNPAS